MIKVGVYTDLTSEDYHAHKESISRSALMDFNKSHYNYWAKHLNPNRPNKDATPAMILGSAFHSFVLEPEKFNNEYVKEPIKVLLKDVGRDKYEEYKQSLVDIEKQNKIILSHDEWDNIMNMFRVFEKNSSALELISNARIENSFFWQDKESGLLLKARPDILHENMIVDLKTCSDASPRAFQTEMVKYGYHVQMAMICDAVEALEGRRIENFINVCIETKYPYNMAIYMIDVDAVNAGEEKYKRLCVELKNCLTTNTFNDYGIHLIGLPKWAI